MEKLLDVSAVAELLCLSKLSVYGLVARSQIPHVKLSRRMLRFRAADITEWIEKKAHDPHVIHRKEKKISVSKPMHRGHNNVAAIVRRARSEVLDAKK